VRKIKEVLRLKFDVGLGLRQIARSCSIGLGTVHEYLSELKLPESRGRLGRIGTKPGWRLPCSAARHGLARRCWRCRISPTFTSSVRATHI
jgi:hypothetical protein